MGIVAYIHPDRVGNPETGVSKHIREMVLGLAGRPGVDLSILTAKRDWTDRVRRVGRHPFEHLQRTELPGRRKWLEKIWTIADWPAVDRWCPGADWVYCPMEAYVPARRPRLAVTVHALYWFETSLPNYSKFKTDRARWRLRLRRVLRRDDILIPVVSGYLKSQLVNQFGVRPERIVVVGNGVEEVYYRTATAPPPASTGPPYLLVVGGLTIWKGGEATLNVAQALRARGSDLEIRIAGVSEPALAEAARAHPNVRHVGYVGMDDGLPELMRGATALLFVSSCDTFGIPAAEAMAVGTPAIVSRNGGLPEVVGSGGMIVDASKPDDVADRIIALADDPAAREDLIARGRKRAVELTWDRCVDRLLEAFRRTG
jgi:glycosyltransferase involved in cell wall biosynthesis